MARPWGAGRRRREGKKGGIWRTLGSFLLENQPTRRSRPYDGGRRVLGKVSGVADPLLPVLPPAEGTESCDKGLLPLHQEVTAFRASLWPNPATLDTLGSPTLFTSPPQLLPPKKQGLIKRDSHYFHQSCALGPSQLQLPICLTYILAPSPRPRTTLTTGCRGRWKCPRHSGGDL